MTEKSRPQTHRKASIYGVVLPRTFPALPLIEELRLVAHVEREYVQATDGQLHPPVLRVFYPSTIEVLRFSPIPPSNKLPSYMQALGRSLALKKPQYPEMVILAAEAWVTTLDAQERENARTEVMVVEGLDRDRHAAAILLPILRGACGRVLLGENQEHESGVYTGTLDTFWNAYHQLIVERSG